MTYFFGSRLSKFTIILSDTNREKSILTEKINAARFARIQKNVFQFHDREVFFCLVPGKRTFFLSQHNTCNGTMHTRMKMCRLFDVPTESVHARSQCYAKIQ